MRFDYDAEDCLFQAGPNLLFKDIVEMRRKALEAGPQSRNELTVEEFQYIVAIAAWEGQPHKQSYMMKIGELCQNVKSAHFVLSTALAAGLEIAVQDGELAYRYGDLSKRFRESGLIRF